MNKRLLLLSNSTLPGQKYLQFAGETINTFLKDTKDGIFIPFAAVTFSYDSYIDMVNNALSEFDIKLKSIHDFEDKVLAIRSASCIVVGGGNTFRLLERCYHFDILNEIHKKVNEGTPYIGWSAGSNLAGPTISTTNDMPIIEPLSFKALNLIEEQINPHFTNELPAGHKGETREQRILEFLEINPSKKVLAIPEGTYIKVEGNVKTYSGNKTGFIYERGNKTVLQSGIF